MKNFKLKIELLSDLCVADGGVYNSSVDTDICQDEYGMPYIPAKRIRGCLRECAQELCDWAVDIEPEKLFGAAGNKANKGKIRISDAHLLGYKDYIQEICNGNEMVYHPQNVLLNFSSIRSQTAIDDKTGTAKDNSLRTIRVANKGLVFESEVELIDDALEDSFKSCCKIFRNMGLARTRGLGEIEVSVIDIENRDEKGNMKPYHDETVLSYKLHLLEPMICKSINGGESNSYDYIEGNKIIGLLAKTLSDNERLKSILSDDSLVFSNAYLEKNGKRLIEVPSYLYAIKNNKINYINRLVYSDKDDSKPRQINGMKHCYVSFEGDELYKASVEMVERYHHSRPEDKAIGRATDTDNSKFYQISSIKQGQTFAGYIKGDKNVIKEIYSVLSDVNICHMGYGSTSEYGKCEFSIEPINISGSQLIKSKEIVTMINSPVIIYNEHAMYSTSFDDLMEEILIAIGVDKEKVDMDKTQRFIRYTNVGGYNVTWNARKPVIGAFDKGTAIKIVFKDEQEVLTDDKIYIGERNLEGYGECIIEPLTASINENDWTYVHNSNQEEYKNTVGGKLGKNICRRLFDDYIKMEAAQIVINNKKLLSEKSRPTVSNILLMCNEMHTMQEINHAIEERFGKNGENKKNKKDIAVSIISLVNDNCDILIQKYCVNMNINSSLLEYTKDEVSIKLLVAMLIEIKYQIRAKKGGNSNE